MSLVSNQANVAFASKYSVDKIVGVYEGSYNRATDVTARAYTYLGSPYNVYFYRIPHGLTRPVFCDLLWSTDGGTTYLDGGAGTSAFGDVSIAFSDSTYIYIYDSQGAASSGTVRYKVIAFWVDNYDGTNPTVPGYTSGNKEVAFDTRKNYQKIYLQGQLNFSFTSGVFSESTQNITHGLGSRKNFRVFFDCSANEVWPMNSGGTSNLFNFSDSQSECSAVMTSTQLSITMTHYASSTRTTGKAWYRIYLDE